MNRDAMNLMKNMPRSSAATALVIGSCALAVPATAQTNVKSDSPAAAASSDHETELSDSEILGIVDTVNTGEIDDANIAVEKAHSDSVKLFARASLTHHIDAKEQDRKLLPELGVTVSAMGAILRKDAGSTLLKLELALPSAFDRTYLESQIQLKETVIAAFDRVIPETQGPQLKALVTYMRERAERDLSNARFMLDALDS